MSQDQQSYTRATQAALMGLIVHFLVASGLALIGIWTQSLALQAFTWHALGGLLIWVILAMLYNQHRLERIEALESEELARDDAIFDEYADNLALARRRVERLYKWGMNSVGVLLALYLIISCVVYIYFAQNAGWASLLKQPLGEEVDRVILLVLMIVVGFISFIMARYIAGMTLVAQWQLLRGGASYLMGITVISLLVAIASGLAHVWQSHHMLAALAWIVPILMGLIGLEMLMTFFLGAYRPRRAGEVPRPAFDSRVLGWFTSPESIARIISETINYQFGFEVSRSWFYRLLAKAITPLVVFGILALILISSLVIVRPYEQAVITRFGDIVDANVSPGLHLKMPWPISRAKSYPVGRIQHLRVGSTKEDLPDTAILWDTLHAIDEESYLMTAPTPHQSNSVRKQVPAREKSAASSVSLVGAEFVVQYKISDLEQYIKHAVAPEQMLEAIANRRITGYFATKDIDWLLAPGRILAGDELRRMLQVDADEAQLAVEFVYVGLTNIHPPAGEQQVASAFHEQIGAKQEARAEIEKAHKESTELLAEVAGSNDKAIELYLAIEQLEQNQQQRTKLRSENASSAQIAEMHQQVLDAEARVAERLRSARGKAATTIFGAQAYRWEKALSERAKAESFEANMIAYANAPLYFRAQHHLEAIAAALTGARKYIIGVEGDIPPTMRIDLTDPSSTFGGLIMDENQ